MQRECITNRLWKTALAVLISLILAGAPILAEQDTPPAGPFGDLAATLAEIQAQLDALSGGIDLAALQTQLNTIQAGLNSLTQTVSNLRGDVDGLTTPEDLRGVAQNWDKKLDSTNGDSEGCNSDRFTCLFDDTLVRDNETGLVWDREPPELFVSWGEAVNQCFDRIVGGRTGYRLPTTDELGSLFDRDNRSPALPAGHPFEGINAGGFWAATTATTRSFPNGAWAVDISNGVPFISDKRNFLGALCVRAPGSLDGQTQPR